MLRAIGFRCPRCGKSLYEQTEPDADIVRCECGFMPEERFCLTPEEQAALKRLDEAQHRSRKSNYLFTDQPKQRTPSKER